MKLLSGIEEGLLKFIQYLYGKKFLVIGLISAVVLLPYLYACQFIHPFGDDLVFSSRIEDFGRMEFIVKFFQGWSGRYMANTLIAIPEANLEESFYMYRLIPFVFLGFLVFSIHHFLREFTIKTISFTQSLIICFSLVAIYVSFMPEPFSAFYWYCSSYYLPAISFYFLFLKFLVKYFLNENKGTTTVFLLFLFCFIVSGLVEIFIFFNIVILFLIVFHSRFVSSKRKSDWVAVGLLLFTFSLLFFILKFSGTDNRIEVSASDYGFLPAAIRSFYEIFLLHFARLFTTPFGILIFILAVIINNSDIRKNPAFSKLISMSPLFIFSVGFICFYLAHALSLYGAGYTLQGRVLNITNLLFIFYILLFISAVLSRNPIVIHDSHKRILFSGVVIIFMLGLFSKPTIQLIMESKYLLPEFDRQLNERYREIQKAKDDGQKVVVIRPITVNPRSFYLGEYNHEINFHNSQKAMRDLSAYYKMKVELSRKADKLDF